MSGGFYSGIYPPSHKASDGQGESMKKIALLFTIVCAAGQLYGMEAQNIMGLPEDVRNEIIRKALAASDTLEEAIKAIKVGALRGVNYDNPKDFTKLVHVLAKKFDLDTATVAQEFRTTTVANIAKNYLIQSRMLLKLIASYDADDIQILIDDIKKLISYGADVNFVQRPTGMLPSLGFNEDTPLIKIFSYKPYNVQEALQRIKTLVELLLEYGGIPDKLTLERFKVYVENTIHFYHPNLNLAGEEIVSKIEEIRQLLEGAMQ